MKLLRISALLIFFAACQSSVQEKQQPAVAVDSLAIAIENMRAALDSVPQDAELRMYLANALLEHHQYEAADSQAMILAKDKASLDKAAYVKALIALHWKDTAQTIARLTEAVSLRGKKSEYEAVMMLADLFTAKHLQDSAYNYYTLAHGINLEAAEPSYNVGHILEAKGNNRMAAAWYREAIRREPAYTAAYIALGNLSEEAGKLKEALGLFNMATKSDPTNATTFYHRGRVFLKLGEKPAGLDDLTKALSFRKNYPEAKALLDSALAGKNH